MSDESRDERALSIADLLEETAWPGDVTGQLGDDGLYACYARRHVDGSRVSFYLGKCTVETWKAYEEAIRTPTEHGNGNGDGDGS